MADADLAGLAELGVEVDTADALLWAAAVGTTLALWRNTVIENWHAGPDSRLTDGEMMRASVASTRLIRERLALTSSDFKAIGAALTARDRVMPDGRTLLEVAPTGRHLDVLRSDVAKAAARLAEEQDRRDPRRVLVTLAVRTAFGGLHLFGMPRWPGIVAAFCRAVDDPHDVHCGAALRHPDLRARRPADIADTSRLRELLLAGPDRLSAPGAAWCVAAGIGYATPQPS